jgi:hypothetical protein
VFEKSDTLLILYPLLLKSLLIEQLYAILHFLLRHLHRHRWVWLLAHGDDFFES